VLEHAAKSERGLLIFAAPTRAREAGRRDAARRAQQFTIFAAPTRARTRLGGAMPTDLLGPPGWCSGYVAGPSVGDNDGTVLLLKGCLARDIETSHAFRRTFWPVARTDTQGYA